MYMRIFESSAYYLSRCWLCGYGIMGLTTIVAVLMATDSGRRSKNTRQVLCGCVANLTKPPGALLRDSELHQP